MYCTKNSMPYWVGLSRTIPLSTTTTNALGSFLCGEELLWVRSRATPDWVLIGSKLLNLQHVSSERLSRGERDRRMES